MKTYPLIAFLAAFFAFAFSTISFELAVSLLFAAGFGSVMLHDYARRARRLRTRTARVLNFPGARRETTLAFELAA